MPWLSLIAIKRFKLFDSLGHTFFLARRTSAYNMGDVYFPFPRVDEKVAIFIVSVRVFYWYLMSCRRIYSCSVWPPIFMDALRFIEITEYLLIQTAQQQQQQGKASVVQ